MLSQQPNKRIVRRKNCLLTEFFNELGRALFESSWSARQHFGPSLPETTTTDDRARYMFVESQLEDALVEKAVELEAYISFDDHLAPILKMYKEAEAATAAERQVFWENNPDAEDEPESPDGEDTLCPPIPKSSGFHRIGGARSRFAKILRTINNHSYVPKLQIGSLLISHSKSEFVDETDDWESPIDQFRNLRTRYKDLVLTTVRVWVSDPDAALAQIYEIKPKPLAKLAHGYPGFQHKATPLLYAVCWRNLAVAPLKACERNAASRLMKAMASYLSRVGDTEPSEATLRRIAKKVLEQALKPDVNLTSDIY
jgi:hypothetical protein